MLLRNSILGTKKLFKKTIDNVKSFLSSKTPAAYERLPKTPPFNPFSCGKHNRVEKMEIIHISSGYKDCTNNQWSLSKSGTLTAAEAKAHDQKKGNIGAPIVAEEKYQEDRKLMSSSLQKKVSGDHSPPDKPKEYIDNHNGRREIGRPAGNRDHNNPGGRRHDSVENDHPRRRNCWVTEKLKEIEMIDKSNIDHLLDIEEVLHYYSRLTCPPYLEIVDNFFAEMYAEFSSSATPEHSVPLPAAAGVSSTDNPKAKVQQYVARH